MRVRVESQRERETEMRIQWYTIMIHSIGEANFSKKKFTKFLKTQEKNIYFVLFCFFVGDFKAKLYNKIRKSMHTLLFVYKIYYAFYFMSLRIQIVLHILFLYGSLVFVVAALLYQ